jgi:hypothetical protein
LSAWRSQARHLFCIPVLALVIAAADILYRGLLR